MFEGLGKRSCTKRRRKKTNQNKKPDVLSYFAVCGQRRWEQEGDGGAVAGPLLGFSRRSGPGAGEPGGCYHLAARARSSSRLCPGPAALPGLGFPAGSSLKSHCRENKRVTPEQKPQPLCTNAGGKVAARRVLVKGVAADKAIALILPVD